MKKPYRAGKDTHAFTAKLAPHQTVASSHSSVQMAQCLQVEARSPAHLHLHLHLHRHAGLLKLWEANQF